MWHSIVSFNLMNWVMTNISCHATAHWKTAERHRLRISLSGFGSRRLIWLLACKLGGCTLLWNVGDFISRRGVTSLKTSIPARTAVRTRIAFLLWNVPWSVRIICLPVTFSVEIHVTLYPSLRIELWHTKPYVSYLMADCPRGLCSTEYRKQHGRVKYIYVSNVLLWPRIWII
jgi:hypothetical protein